TSVPSRTCPLPTTKDHSPRRQNRESNFPPSHPEFVTVSFRFLAGSDAESKQRACRGNRLNQKVTNPERSLGSRSLSKSWLGMRASVVSSGAKNLLTEKRRKAPPFRAGDIRRDFALS